MHPSDGTLRRSLDEPVAIDAAKARPHRELRAMRGAGSAHDAQMPDAAFAATPCTRRSRRRRRCGAGAARATGGGSAGCAGQRSMCGKRPPSPRRPGASRLIAGLGCCRTASMVLVVSGWRPGFPEPLPANPARGRPGHGIGCALARRTHRATDRHRRSSSPIEPENRRCRSRGRAPASPLPS